MNKYMKKCLKLIITKKMFVYFKCGLDNPEVISKVYVIS